jgi:hypothetical protein
MPRFLFLQLSRFRLDLIGAEGQQMILAPLTAAALILSVTTGPNVVPHGSTDLSVAQKNAAAQKLVRTATDCIARTVAADPRFRTQAELGELIVDSMPACLGQVRAMIDVYDQYFGDGMGEAFFMGPYLDLLPKAIIKWVGDHGE